MVTDYALAELLAKINVATLSDRNPVSRIFVHAV